MEILKHIKNVPAALTDLNQWVCWKAVERDGRETKMPINATTGNAAKSNDSTTWTGFNEAVDAHCGGIGSDGVGFVFSPDDGMVGIDLDACISENGKVIEEWALTILYKFASYAEISPSGRGLKIWCRGTIAKGYKKNLGEKDPTIDKAPGIEVYATGRYFAVTGKIWEGPISKSVIEAQHAIDWLIKRHFTEEPSIVIPSPEVEAQNTRPKEYTYTQGLKSFGEIGIQERAARYLAKLPVAVAGEHGHDKTYHATCVLVIGFAMSVNDALPVFEEWNQTCIPPWSDADLRRKLDQVNQLGGQRGDLLTARAVEGPDVDLSGVLTTVSLAESADLEEVEPACVVPNPSNFPPEAMKPPGFLADLIDFNLSCAFYPIPELALAGHLALLSTLTGQKIADRKFGTRPNGYFVGLMPSGGGKDAARMINKKILWESGNGNLEGEETFASSAAIWSAADSQPVGLYQVDEIANLLMTTNDPRANPHLFKIVDVLLR